jgi:hypothetical protein
LNKFWTCIKKKVFKWFDFCIRLKFHIKCELQVIIYDMFFTSCNLSFANPFKFMINPKWKDFIFVKHLSKYDQWIFQFSIFTDLWFNKFFYPQIFNVAMLVIFQKEIYPNLVIKQLWKYKCIKILLYHG